MPQIEFEGQAYDFPEDATQEEITHTLNAIPAEENETPEEPAEPLREQVVIKKDEGVKKNKEGQHVAYSDKEGNKTGGRGHLLNKEEKKLYPEGTVIPDDVVKQWFKEDMNIADEELTSILEGKKVHVPDAVYDILLNMTFNLGGKGIRKFKKMWAAVEDEDWQTVSSEMLLSEDGKSKSLWLTQVGKRAERLSRRMAAIQSNVQAAPEANLSPVTGGLFEDDNGKLFMVDSDGNKTEV